MPPSDDEIQRLQRLRDQQLAARRPNEKREQYLQTYHARYSKRKPLTLKEIVNVFSNKWKGAFFGVLIGLLAWYLLFTLVQANWVAIVGPLVALVCVILGVVIGSSFDWRDDLRHF
jgi:hypothetical protein